MDLTGENLEGLFSMEDRRGQAIEDTPFHLLVIGDWSGTGAKPNIQSRRPLEIDRDNFDEVLSRLSPKVVEVNGNPLSISFSEIDDFHPDHVFEQVSAFSELRDLRRRLKNPDSFNEAAREVRSWFPVAATSEVFTDPVVADTASDSSDDLLSQILSQPGGSAPRPQKASSELAGFISELIRPHLLNVDENEQSRLVAAVDAATSELMRAVIHDHKFQALEAAWRGLYFLVRRAETDNDLKIFILNISKEELAADLKSESLSDSFFYSIVVKDTVETPGADEWATVIGNYAFLPSVDDVATLVRISKICAAADAPFVSHMRPDVLGIQTLDGHTDPREWDLSGTADFGKLWSALRSMPESNYLGMTIPRFLGRLPYGLDWDPIETFSFEEFDNMRHHNSYLWINSCFACAALLAQSFSENGWEMGGGRFVKDLERLPLYTYESDGETVYQPCAEVQITHEGCDKLMEYGLMPLVSYKNTDHIKLARFQSITDPVTGLRGKWKRG